MSDALREALELVAKLARPNEVCMGATDECDGGCLGCRLHAIGIAARAALAAEPEGEVVTLEVTFAGSWVFENGGIVGFGIVRDVAPDLAPGTYELRRIPTGADDG